VLRGGSWNNNQRNARCAYRNRNIPDNFNNNIGFRVVVSIAFDPGREILSFREAGRSPIIEKPAQSGPGRAAEMAAG
jgi:hypothetical protein